MPNPNPSKARRAKQARRASQASARDLLGRVWDAVDTAHAALADPDVSVRLKAVHAVNQGSTAYTKALEAAEFEDRLRAVEAELGLTSKPNP